MTDQIRHAQRKCMANQPIISYVGLNLRLDKTLTPQRFPLVRPGSIF